VVEYTSDGLTLAPHEAQDATKFAAFTTTRRQRSRRQRSTAAALRACKSKIKSNLATIQHALDAQHDGQRHQNVTVGHQQITGRNTAMRDEGLDCFLAAADQQGQLTRLPSTNRDLNC
jgi:hypothetical protein